MKQVIHAFSRLCFLFLFLLPLVAGCAAKVENRPEDIRLVTAQAVSNGKHPPPSFLISEWQHPYNRIGMVRAEQHDGYESIFIDPEQAVIYKNSFSFSTDRATYSNQVFRVHFQKTPFSLIPFHFTAGNNGGLLVIITFDVQQRPILVTTVNTCGCYVTIIPTSFLAPETYPVGWPEKNQEIYGEMLPARLEMSSPDAGFLISVRPSVHRIMNLQVIEKDTILPKQKVEAMLRPLASLESLPVNENESTSMYYKHWPLDGHVKGAIKPWESLLLSLISLDFYVGMDKKYDSTNESENPFYTSLKPWNRNLSDLNDFVGFLNFYGWKL